MSAVREGLRGGMTLLVAAFSLGGFLCRTAGKCFNARPAPFFFDVPAFAEVIHATVLAQEAKP